MLQAAVKDAGRRKTLNPKMPCLRSTDCRVVYCSRASYSVLCKRIVLGAAEELGAQLPPSHARQSQFAETTLSGQPQTLCTMEAWRWARRRT